MSQAAATRQSLSSTPMCGTSPAMQIHVDEQSHLDDLLAFLRKIGCIALRVDGCTLEVHVPETTNERDERLAARTSAPGRRVTPRLTRSCWASPKP